MGWLWASTSSPSASENGTTSTRTPEDTSKSIPSPNDAASPGNTDSGFGLTEEQRIRIFGRPTATPSSSDKADQHTDVEVEAFLKSLEEPSTTKPNSQEPQVSRKPQPQRTQARTIDRVRPDGSLDISLDVMHPRTMSCWEAFDELWYCQSLGGKFNDIYRYGEAQSCSEQLAAWTFCMRTRMQPEEHKQAQIRDFYAARDAERKKKYGSSEDVWEARETAVDKAFWKPHPDKLGIKKETKE